MEYNALTIKNWIISKISPMGWSMLISRSMPELLENNPAFSAYYINKRTVWDETDLKIVRIYLLKMYNLQLPEEVMKPTSSLPVDYLDLVSFDFFGTSRLSAQIKNSLKSISKLFST